MSTHKPTVEQSAIISAFQAGATLVVEAGAGCGKSSSLKMAALAKPHAKGIYVAYNRSLADEAKRSFPSSVWCKTAHGLAFGPVGKRFAHRLNGPRLPAREVARILRINDPVRLSDAMAPLAPQQLARIVMETVGRFCNSADQQVERWHLKRIDAYQRLEMEALRDVVVPLARTAWADLSSVDGRLKYTHDCYLKSFAMSDPKLQCDFLLLDEAQDCSPVMSSIFDGQTHVQRIAVGDASQAIYQWRGAIDALSKFDADRRLTLSQSFRFGQAVADEANKWLDILDAPIRLRGFDPINSRVGQVAAPDAVLCRTNGEAVAQLMSAARNGRRAALLRGGREIRALAEAAITLKAGLGTDHPELFMFRTWFEVQDYCEQDSAGSDLKVFVRLVDDHGPEAVIGIIDTLVPEDRADVIVSTAHSAKGREWGSVLIADDFREPKATEKEPDPEIAREDAMLAYVAVTRAQRVLDRGGLAWVDRWLPGAVRPRFNPVAATADLTGMPEEQADWDSDDADQPAAEPAAVPHCRRCGSDRCICDPEMAAEYSARCGVPAGPVDMRRAFATAGGVR